MDSACSARVPSYSSAPAVAVNHTRSSVVANAFFGGPSRVHAMFEIRFTAQQAAVAKRRARGRAELLDTARPNSNTHVLRASTRRPKCGTSKPPACFPTRAAAFMGSRNFPSTWTARRGQQNWLHDVRHVGIVCCGGRRLLRFGAERGTEQEQFVARRCSASAAIGRLPHECAMRASAEATCSHTAFDAYCSVRVAWIVCAEDGSVRQPMAQER